MKNNRFKRLNRGPTFVGLSPKVEKTKKEKLEKEYTKHRGKEINDFYFSNNCYSRKS